MFPHRSGMPTNADWCNGKTLPVSEPIDRLFDGTPPLSGIADIWPLKRQRRVDVVHGIAF